jgi:HSP20 family protein
MTMWMGIGDYEQNYDVFDELRRQLDRVFEDVGGRAGQPAAAVAGPRASLQDTGAELKLEAEIPGLTDKDVQLTLTQDALTMTGERKTDAPEGYSVHRRERPAYRFSRSFALPCKVDAERATATVKNGVLTVNLPKAAEARPRQISIKAS